jgi:dienelactone hydrolase
MTMIEVSYNDGDVALTGALYLPEVAPRAGVVVFPTIMNPTQSVNDKAADLAARGYLALVADFYGATPASFDEARDLAMGIRATPDTYRCRLRASVKALAARSEAAGLPIGAIGFCMGGQAVLELARDGAPLFAAVSFHGLLDTDLPAEQGGISARTLVCHGDADPMVPRSRVMAFWEEMDAAGADWHFHSYAGVKHGFTNPAPNPNPATGYNASADRQSWAAMYALFDEVLEAPEAD